ncbi:Uma2 family endonuclease [Pirellulaceae bacterium SH449]
MDTQLIFTTQFASPLPIHKFTVEQYHRLGEMGVLTPEDKVELLEGWIVEKMNQKPIHGFIVAMLNELIQCQLPKSFKLRCQLPITTERSEPEPDIAIIQGVHEAFRTRHPSGIECRLIIEVADTSLEKDRAKACIYREAGVQEYWIVNVADSCVERYKFSDPESQSPEIISSNSSLTITLDDRRLELDLKHLFQ